MRWMSWARRSREGPSWVPGLALLADGHTRGGLLPLVGAEAFVVGSAPSATVRVQAQGVEPEHCEVRRGADGFTVNDLKSRGGTFVGDARAFSRHDVRGRIAEIAQHLPADRRVGIE